MNRTIYPYPVLRGRTDVEVTRVRLDGVELEFAGIGISQRTVALAVAGRDEWQEAAIEIRAELPETEIADGPWSELVCVAVLEEAATNVRTVHRLTKDRGSGTWQGTVRMARSRHHSRAGLRVQVVATVGGIPGRRIGGSESDWVLDLHAKAPQREQESPAVVEVDFRDGPHSWLRPMKDAPWFVDTAGGDMPVVYLNQAVEGLTTLLSGKGGPAAKATAALAGAKIESDVWEAMFHAAVGDVEADEEGRPRMPTGWRESVLQTMLPDVLPGLSPSDAIVEFSARREEGYGWAELQSRVQYAAALRAQLPKQLANAMRATVRPEGEDR
ncbi:hypothetical protein [Peterkaempfera griseoplana]|uniref:hypothetical protein n=1 Tax=Peterkaempfera griseoplana TaxID=66896 RepID=UPI0006E23F8D|nr:hypothetical protein [Peterkaempfera griseoplana]